MRNNDLGSLNDELFRISVNLGNLIGKKEIKGALHMIGVVGIFPQTWSDTACGFGGMAGQAIATAFTVVLQDNSSGQYYVFINGQYAYTASHESEKFKEDFRNRKLSGKVGSSKYKV